MSALLRAEWLRFRRRRDFWIIGIAVLILAAVTFLASYRSEVTDPIWPDAAAIRDEVRSFTDFTGSGLTQAEIDEQLATMIADQTAMYDDQRRQWEEDQATVLQKFDVTQSPFTVLGSGLAPLLALVLIASLAVGDEFRFGTVRTSLLAANRRRRLLVARLISLFVMTVGLIGALVLLGLVLGVGLRLVGAEVTPTRVPIDGPTAVALVGAEILTTMVVILLGVALTLLLRSGALPLLLILVAGLAELFIANLPVFAQGEFLWGVPQVFPMDSINRLTGELALDTRAVAFAGNELRPVAIDLPLIAEAGIVVAWGVLFVVIADHRFRTMDVVE